MSKSIGISELPRGVRGVVDEVAHQKTSILLTRNQRPEAAIIPYEDYLHFQAMRESESLMHFHELRSLHARMGNQLGDE
jgi:prevent-host-death family protein